MLSSVFVRVILGYIYSSSSSSRIIINIIYIYIYNRYDLKSLFLV